MDYIALIEKATDGSYSAYLPDLPGCVACGDTVDEVKSLISEAVELHVKSLREHGEDVPAPSASTALVHAA